MNISGQFDHRIRNYRIYLPNMNNSISELNPARLYSKLLWRRSCLNPIELIEFKYSNHALDRKIQIEQNANCYDIISVIIRNKSSTYQTTK